jgi:hypothetical protein
MFAPIAANGSGYDSCLRQAGRCDFKLRRVGGKSAGKGAIEICQFVLYF